MSIDALYPANGDNAILQVAFIVEWQTALNEEDLREVRKLQPIFSDQLPDLQESQSMSVTFSPNGAVDTRQQVSQLDGLHFVKADIAHGGRPIRSLQVNRNSLVAIVANYDRWDTVWNTVYQWFQHALTTVGRQRGFTGLTLQYTDSFQWRDNPALLNISEVFMSGSPYLPPYVYSSSSLWHSHHGYIEKLNEPVNSNLINNINVDLVDHNKMRVLNINSSHKAIFNEPLWDSNDFSEIQAAFFERLHQKNKDQLTKLLSPEVCGKISLKS
ncbi:MAG TPA: hypothetical protein DD803_04185 [Alcaligenes faecalis]|nr:hypothetical protein [Alcaligenes faecalis]HBQ88644.1 hypothetical protein [Alcaligenes faecalis]